MKRFKVLRKVEEGSNEVYFDVIDNHNNKSAGYYMLLDTDNSKINYGMLSALELRDALEDSCAYEPRRSWNLNELTS
tara:strand:+ start:618 stop:848 length:231 start_codon:yes stop_codon:yes gene_type:complete